jgi:hypothetical protein
MCDYVLLATMCLYVRLCLTLSKFLRPCVNYVLLYVTICTMYEDVLLCVIGYM